MSSNNSSQPRRQLAIHDYTVGWISALPIEHAAAAELLDEEHESLPAQGNDSSLYTLGRVAGHNVVIACLPAGVSGTASAAIVATRLFSRFPNVKIGLMVGIAGGVPTEDIDIRLGDVVVSQPRDGFGGVVQYDFGKAMVHGSFQHTGHLDKPPTLLLSALSQVQSDHFQGRSRFTGYLAKLEENFEFVRKEAGPDHLFKPTYLHAGGSSCNQCDTKKLVERDARSVRKLVQIHYGTVASGNTVIKDAAQRDQICQTLGGGILCFEMEAAGLMNEFPCLVIRGICDYADSHKNKRWQSHAAATAAAFAKEILSAMPIAEVAHLAPIRAPWSVPFNRNSRFTGREDILDKLGALFEIAHTHPYVAIYGLGGRGKSAVAIEFAHQIKNRHPCCAVFWVSAFDPSRFEDSYREIAHVLGIPGADNREKNILDDVHRMLNEYKNGKWLMVVDNVDDSEILFHKDPNHSDRRLWDSLPKSQNGMILFTTRSRGIAVDLAPEDFLSLPQIGSVDAKQLLEKSLEQRDELRNEPMVKRFLEHLTYLPLAIIQAVAFMNKNNTPISRYLELMQENKDALLNQDFHDPTRDRASRNAVVATWLISFHQVQNHDPLAAEYLSFVACVAPQNIPWNIFPPAESNIMKEKAIGTLIGYEFLTKNSAGHRYDVHPLIHQVTKKWLQTEDTWISQAQRTIERLRGLTPYGGHENREEYVPYLVHGLYATAIWEIIDTEAAVDLLCRIGSCRYSLGEYKNTEAINRDILERQKRTIVPDDHGALVTMTNLGRAMDGLGKYEESEMIVRQALQSMKKLLGHRHPNTLTTMNNLGAVLSAQRKYKEAEKVYRQTFQLRKRILGKQHPDTISSMGNLASALSEQTKYEAEERINRQVLDLREEVLGKKHPSTLRSMHNLAGTLQRQKKYEESETLFRQTIQLAEKVFGKQHPDTLMSLCSFARLFHDRKEYNPAFKLYVRACTGFVEVLGQDHPTTKNCKAWYAELLMDMEQEGSASDTVESTNPPQEVVLTGNGGESGSISDCSSST